MIRIDKLNLYWKRMSNRVAATQAILVRDESELAQKIKNIINGEMFLVVVIPSSDTRARNSDNIQELELVIVYALKKVAHKDQNDTDVINDMIQTQECITKIKGFLLDDSTNCDAIDHDMISKIDFNKIHTDPEYNYLGCDGYSISLQLTTDGF